MNTNKALTYKTWLDELNTTPSQDFFIIAGQFLELLIKENPNKIQKLIDIFDEESRRLVDCANKAVQALEPVLQEIERILRKHGERIPAKIIEYIEYKDIKAGRMRRIGEDLPDTLYHAIRLTLEEYWNLGIFEQISSNLMSFHEEFWYVDYQKFCKAYPAYKQFRDYKDNFELRRKEEPWGAYIYLKWATGFFKHTALDQAGNFVKTDIISGFRRLILYLITPDPKLTKPTPTKISGIPKLFSLSMNPVGIYYEGGNKSKRKWVYTKGKIQPFAILKLASEKYMRRRLKPDSQTSQIKLSYVEIEEYVSSSKNCDRRPNWKGLLSTKRRLEHLRKNILRLVPFGDNELKVENYNNAAFLVFYPQN